MEELRCRSCLVSIHFVTDSKETFHFSLIRNISNVNDKTRKVCQCFSSPYKYFSFLSFFSVSRDFSAFWANAKTHILAYLQ